MKSNIFALILLALFAASCKEGPTKTIKTEPIVFKKEGELSIYKQKNDSLITSFQIEIAETDYETQTGLMYRDHMDSDQAMLFVFPTSAIHSFYMKNTEIPLDIIYIDEDQKIASFQENARPYDETGLSSQVPVKYVLEVNAGLSEKLQLEVGDRVEFTRNTP